MHPVDTVALFAQRFDSVGLPYMLVGSVAGAFYGRDRHSNDIDLVVDFAARPAALIAAALEPEFFLDVVQVEDARRHGTMANALPRIPAAVWKVDVSPLGSDEFSRAAFPRRTREDWRGTPVAIIRPADLVISKLRWAKDSQSERQLADVRAILAMELIDEDDPDFRHWIARLGLQNLLDSAKATRYDE